FSLSLEYAGRAASITFSPAMTAVVDPLCTPYPFLSCELPHTRLIDTRFGYQLVPCPSDTHSWCWPSPQEDIRISFLPATHSTTDRSLQPLPVVPYESLHLLSDEVSRTASKTLFPSPPVACRETQSCRHETQHPSLLHHSNSSGS
ncbi:exo-alpha-sialidase, partial [Trypanosoma cruzi]